MAKKVNLIDQIFGSLKVIRYLDVDERTYRLKTWLCLCNCGNFVQVATSHLRNGNVVSCGCVKEASYVCDKKSNTKEYNSYHSMILRCTGYDKNYTDKKRKICKRWLEDRGQGFLNFLQDMGERPEGTTLERVDNSKNYTPENCKWENLSTQSFNRDIFKNNNSGRTGVSYRKDTNCYRAWINKENKRINLGSFSNIESAIKARRDAELKYFGYIKEE